LVAPGVASGSPPELGTFSTTGYTDLTSYRFETLPSGLTKFYLEAEGEPGLVCAFWFSGDPNACGVSGDLDGTFTFIEWGIVDMDPLTQVGSGRGTNHGILTINSDDSELTIRFDGQTDSQYVWGNYRILSGTGEYANLHGQGKYHGNAGFAFTVTYEGKFHMAPR
jgi:hypothetical protein